jgi:hypothetical protein
MPERPIRATPLTCRTRVPFRVIVSSPRLLWVSVIAREGIDLGEVYAQEKRATRTQVRTATDSVACLKGSLPYRTLSVP